MGSRSYGRYVLSCALVAGMIAVMGISVPVGAINLQVFSDTFDDGDYAGWTVANTPGNIVEVSQETLHVVKSAKVYGPARITSPEINLRNTADYWMEIRFLVPSGVTQNEMLLVDDGRVYITISDSRKGCNLIVTGGQSSEKLTITKGEWHYLRMNVYPADGYYDVLLDPGYIWYLPEDPNLETPDTWIKGVTFRAAFLDSVSMGTEISVSRKCCGELYMDTINYTGSIDPWEYLESFDTEDALDDWSTILMPTSVCELSSSVYYSPPYSVHLAYSPSYKAGMTRITSPLILGDFSNFYSIDFRYRHHTGNILVMVDDGVIELVNRYGDIFAVGPSSEVFVTSIVPDTWYSFDLLITPSEDVFSVWVNGQLKGSAFPQKSDRHDIAVSFGSRLETTMSDYGEAYWDSLRVHGSTGSDADGDGITSYDEINVFGTDPWGIDKWAIMVIGPNEFDDCTDIWYRTLKSLGYSDDHICFLSYSLDGLLREHDADRDGINDIDLISTLENMDWAMSEWLPSVSDCDDIVTIYIHGHGGSFADSEGELTCGFTSIDIRSSITDIMMEAWLDNLEANGDYGKLVFVLDSCSSGNWLIGPDTVAGFNRIIFTSGQPGEITGPASMNMIPYLIHVSTFESAYELALIKNPYISPMLDDQCDPDSNPHHEVYL